MLASIMPLYKLPSNPLYYPFIDYTAVREAEISDINMCIYMLSMVRCFDIDLSLLDPRTQLNLTRE